MSARRIGALVALAGLAPALAAPALGGCRAIAGIEDIAYDDAGQTACPTTAPTVVFQQAGTSFDKLSIQNGVLYAGLFDPNFLADVGAVSCPTSGCTTPTQLARNDTAWGDFGVGTSLVYYTLLGTVADLPDGGTAPAKDGTIHTVKLDGTGDVVAEGSLAYPYWAGASNASATRFFWANDPVTFGDTGEAEVDCLGCSGATSVPWITNIGGTYQVFADANNVYVLADDATLTTGVLLGCSAQTACGATPRLVLSQLDVSGTSGENSFASDGTNVYAARAGHADIIRIDPSGMTTTLASGQQGATGLAYDATGAGGPDVYWGTSTGIIYRAKADGSSATPQAVVCQQANPRSIVVDATTIYFVTGASGSTGAVSKIPKP